MTIKQYISRIFDPIFLTHIRLNAALESILTPLVVEGGGYLDVGCGERPYEYLFSRGRYVGVDVKQSGRPMSMKQPDYFYDGIELPFADDSFDIVFSTQVLEHVKDPLVVLKEMARVCKPMGSCVISVPFLYQEHEEPFDYLRFTRFGIEELLLTAGLKVEAVRKDTSGLEAIAIMFNVYLISNLIPGIKGIGRLYSLFICLPVQLIAIGLSKIFPDKGQLYLNIVVHARKNA